MALASVPFINLIAQIQHLELLVRWFFCCVRSLLFLPSCHGATTSDLGTVACTVGTMTAVNRMGRTWIPVKPMIIGDPVTVDRPAPPTARQVTKCLPAAGVPRPRPPIQSSDRTALSRTSRRGCWKAIFHPLCLQRIRHLLPATQKSVAVAATVVTGVMAEEAVEGWGDQEGLRKGE